LLILGGEAWRKEWYERLREGGAECRVMNHYGPTECTVGVTTCEVELREKVEGGAVPLGRGLGNCRVYVMDEGMELAGIGVPGELYVGGAQVARGYMSKAGQTAEKFVPDLLGAEGGARLYRTGDRVRWRADGNLEFLGRRDRQVKVRGYRIEP